MEVLLAMPPASAARTKSLPTPGSAAGGPAQCTAQHTVGCRRQTLFVAEPEQMQRPVSVQCDLGKIVGYGVEALQTKALWRGCAISTGSNKLICR